MLKNLSQKLAAAAAAVVLAAGAAGAGVLAQTNTVGGVVDVAPGERRCLDHPAKAFSSASVYDYVVYGAPVKFIFLGRNENSGDFLVLGNSGEYPVFSYYDMRMRQGVTSFFPLFPGFFRTCARNEGAQPSTVYLSVTVD